MPTHAMHTPQPGQSARDALTATLPSRRRMLMAAGTALAVGELVKVHAQTSPVWPEVSSALPDARLVGSTRLRVWGFEVYDAYLWVASDFRARQFAQFPLVLSLRYLRTLKGAAIAERSLEEMRRIGPIPEALADPWLLAMTQLFPDVSAGDRLTGLHQPGVGARFWLNSLPLGDIADARFSASFFGIWLADATSEPALRRELLVGATP